MALTALKKMEIDPEGIYHVLPGWTKKEKKALCNLEEQLVDTKPQLLKEAIAGNIEAAETLKKRFNMTCYIHKGVKII